MTKHPKLLSLLLALCFGARFSAHAAPQVAVEIDLQEQRAYLLRGGRAVLESPICSGRAKYPTPTGRFRIIDKDVDHRSSLYGKIVDARGQTVVADADADMAVPPGGKFINAPMHYFMRFTGGIGMHAGYLPGYPASHGCVRMPKNRAIEFFEAVRVGTPVTVFGRAPRTHGSEGHYGPRVFERPRAWFDRAGRFFHDHLR
jgi:lipoprotein-anchoring transpeptidase ErfK/SrfK